MACIFYKPEKKLVFCIEKIASPAGESQKKATIVVGSTGARKERSDGSARTKWSVTC